MTGSSCSFRTALVVPCYNEEQRLPSQDYLAFIERNPRVFLVFVNDGSTDNTQGCLERLRSECPHNIDVLSTVENQGKGEAVRKGILFAHSSSDYDLLGYWDADLSTPLKELSSFLDVFERKHECQLVSGARVLRMGSDIARHWYRHYAGRVLATGTSIALRLPYYDTQCGAKVFRSNNAALLFGRPFFSRWLFDIEVIYRLKNSVASDKLQLVFYELPLTSWRDVPGSKLGIKDLVMSPYELLKVWHHYS